MTFNFDSFSHGQVVSKVWLCETLEPFITKKSNVAILGSWYNVLAFMMLTRDQSKYQQISGIDIDPVSTDISNKICNAWVIDSGPVKNITSDAAHFDYNNTDVVINCSSEHMNDDWYDKVLPGTLVCIQSSDVVDPNYPWLVTNANPDIEVFKSKYSMDTLLFEGVKEISYTDWGYNRFMIIGIK